MPTGEAFGVLVGALVGRNVKVVRGTPLVPTAVRAVASYVDEAGKVLFVLATDYATCASIGAALAMIPAPTVADAVRTGKVPELLVENAYEVFNVAASLFNDVEGTTVHVKVSKLEVGTISPDTTRRIAKPSARIDRDFGIPGYPDGKFSILSIAA